MYYNPKTKEIENLLIETPQQTIEKLERAEKAASPYKKLKILLGIVPVTCYCHD